MAPIKILIVDDSAFMRKVIGDMIASDPDLVLVGTARNGADALEKIPVLKPDVVTLDVEMPVMDGLTTLSQIMEKYPRPVIMLSSHTREGAEATIRALDLGAADFVSKPSGTIGSNLSSMQENLIVKIKAVAQIKTKQLLHKFPRFHSSLPPKSVFTVPGQGPAALVAIGTSTGGPRALQEVLSQIPAGFPGGILVVQHMPPGFTKSLADRLNSLSQINVREAQDGDEILPGQALIAPGDYHMLAVYEGKWVVRLQQEPLVNGHRPSVNVLMDSVAGLTGIKRMGVILTGMGGDGAEGLKRLRESGGYTVAEDKSTCTVYGMPRVAAEIGAVEKVVPLPQIAGEIIRWVQEG